MNTKLSNEVNKKIFHGSDDSIFIIKITTCLIQRYILTDE